jgi:hypothetical protein
LNPITVSRVGEKNNTLHNTQPKPKPIAYKEHQFILFKGLIIDNNAPLFNECYNKVFTAHIMVLNNNCILYSIFNKKKKKKGKKH